MWVWCSINTLKNWYVILNYVCIQMHDSIIHLNLFTLLKYGFLFIRFQRSPYIRQKLSNFKIQWAFPVARIFTLLKFFTSLIWKPCLTGICITVVSNALLLIIICFIFTRYWRFLIYLIMIDFSFCCNLWIFKQKLNWKCISVEITMIAIYRICFGICFELRMNTNKQHNAT